DVVKELAATAVRDPGQFEHLASRRRQDRERAAQRAAAVEALEASGVRVFTETERYNDHARAASLKDLVDSAGTPLTAENHAGCPGDCAVVHDGEPTEPSYYCLEPAKHGHRSRYGSGRPKGPMTD